MGDQVPRSLPVSGRGRRARLTELDPKYDDVIVKRWQAYTEKGANLDGDGHTFDEIGDARDKTVG